jgi:hypothetical protein
MRRIPVLPSCNCGHLSSVSMFVTELVLWNLLQVYLAALHWTISSLLMLDLVWGSQTQLLYSNFGRIKDVYAFSFTGFEFTFRLRLIKLRCLLAVELMLSMCLFHLRSDWIVTPRYFVEDSVWRVCWWSTYLWCTGIGFFLVVMCMTEHLSGWNCISRSFSHFAAASRSSCSLCVSLSSLIVL